MTTIQFGQFELDLSSGELSKLGHKIRLQSQSFQVLTVLLDSSPQVVTRKELQQILWPGDTHVDFENGKLVHFKWERNRWFRNRRAPYAWLVCIGDATSGLVSRTAQTAGTGAFVPSESMDLNTEWFALYLEDHGYPGLVRPDKHMILRLTNPDAEGRPRRYDAAGMRTVIRLFRRAPSEICPAILSECRIPFELNSSPNKATSFL